MSSKFRGKYLQIIPLGIAHLHFNESGELKITQINFNENFIQIFITKK